MLLDFYGQPDWAIVFNALKCFRYSSLPSIHFCNFRHLNVKEPPRNYRWRIHWLVGEHCYNRRGDSPREQFLLLHNGTASWNMKRLNLEQQLLWYSTWDPYLLAKTLKDIHFGIVQLPSLISRAGQILPYIDIPFCHAGYPVKLFHGKFNQAQ